MSGLGYAAYEHGYREALHSRARSVPARYAALAGEWLRGFDNGHRGKLLAAWRRAVAELQRQRIEAQQ
jgi:hypothetical protein